MLGRNGIQKRRDAPIGTSGFSLNLRLNFPLHVSVLMKPLSVSTPYGVGFSRGSLLIVVGGRKEVIRNAGGAGRDVTR